jgi:hypothetical protein
MDRADTIQKLAVANFAIKVENNIPVSVLCVCHFSNSEKSSAEHAAFQVELLIEFWGLEFRASGDIGFSSDMDCDSVMQTIRAPTGATGANCRAKDRHVGSVLTICHSNLGEIRHVVWNIISERD